MKKLIITLVILLVSSPFFAQSAFNKFDGQEEVISVVVNKKMFELMSKMKVDASNKEMQEYMNLIKKLDNLQSYTSMNEGVRKEMKITADKYIKTAGLEELMRIKNEEGTIRIMVKSGTKENQIKELLMIIDGKAKGNIVDSRAQGTKDEATILVSLTGDFDLNEISVLTDKMKIPGGDDLKKATKDKK